MENLLIYIGYLSSKRPGDQISVGLLRNNKKINLNVILEKNTNVSFLGMQINNTTQEELDNLDLTHGVKILNNRNGYSIQNGY